MKLKGEKELTAEQLYNNIDEELNNILVANNLIMSTLDITDFDYFLDNMYNKSLDVVIIYRIATCILQMDLEVKESKALLELSLKRKLLTSLCDIIRNTSVNVNILSDKELEEHLRTIIYGLLLKDSGEES